MPVLFLLSGPKQIFRHAGATRCLDKRDIFTFVGQKCRNTAPKLSKFQILVINLPLRGHSFAQFLRNSQVLYSSIGSF